MDQILKLLHIMFMNMSIQEEEKLQPDIFFKIKYSMQNLSEV